MTNLTLRIWLLALALAGCDAGRDAEAQSAITVKLPAARPAEPAPGFSFEDTKWGRAASMKGQRAKGDQPSGA